MSAVHVVSHTHWDREWYRSFATFRALLVETAEAVVTQLEQGRLAHFLLDGQTIAVADVLDVRPDLEPRIAALVRAGRLQVGPWHVLADMTLVSGEALVRNLLVGRRWGRRLGGLSGVGYCPDMFGHPPDLPRVLRGFGIGTAVVWRGAPERPVRFSWRSPDGSAVLAVRSRYYEPEVLWHDEGAAQRLRAWLDGQRALDAQGPWLLLNGGDHLAPRDLDRRIAGLDVGVPVREVTLDAHLAGLDPRGLPVVEGELRHAGRAGAFLLAGSLSTRIDLKQANAAAQTLLERWVEPWAVWSGALDEPVSGQAGGLAGGASVRALLDRAWGDLLANQPHDSICGCGTDVVHREDHARARAVLDLGEHVLERCLRRAGLATRLPERPPAGEVPVAVLNPHACPVTGGVEVDLVVAPDRAPVAVRDAAGAAVAFTAVDLGVRKGFDSDVGVLPHWPWHRAWRLRLVAETPPCGWTTLTVRLGDRLPPAAAERVADEPAVAVDGWRLAAAADGSVTLLAEAAGRHLAGLGRLVDGGEAGDTYTAEPPPEDRLVPGRLRGGRAVTSAVDGRLELDVVLDLPRGLTPDRRARDPETVPVPVRVTVRRWRGVPQLEWTVEMAGSVRDHRLRVHVPTGAHAATWRTDAAFSAVERPVPTPPPSPAFARPSGPGEEAAVGTAPLQRWCAAGDVAVLASGLPEAEALATPAGTELALTLLRAVGWLGRGDLRSRTMGAGPPIEVPDAQGTGAHVWRWALRVGDDDDDALAAAADAWAAPLRAVQLTAPPPAPTRSCLAVAAPALLSAVKPAEDGDGAVVRVRNPTGAPVATTLHVPGHAVTGEVDLGEDPVGPAPPDGRVELGPWAVRSWRIRR